VVVEQARIRRGQRTIRAMPLTMKRLFASFLLKRAATFNDCATDIENGGSVSMIVTEPFAIVLLLRSLTGTGVKHGEPALHGKPRL
jgi:hypothetical protein